MTAFDWLHMHGFSPASSLTVALWLFAFLYLVNAKRAGEKFYANTRALLRTIAGRAKAEKDFWRLFSRETLFSRSPFVSSTVVMNSPMKLSRSGKEIARKLDASKTVERELPHLLEQIDKDATMYEIQEICFDYALEKFHENVSGETKKKIHDEAYWDGRGIDDILLIYAVMFRDAVFEKRGLNARR